MLIKDVLEEISKMEDHSDRYHAHQRFLFSDFEFLEVGKSYRSRDCEDLVTITSSLEESNSSWKQRIFRGDNGLNYFEDGGADFEGLSEPKDLILEIWDVKVEPYDNTN